MSKFSVISWREQVAFLYDDDDDDDVRFALEQHAELDNSCLVYVICVCLRIVVSNTYCVVFLFCFSSSLDSLFLIVPSVFYNFI
jgi:hypothetical protein